DRQLQVQVDPKRLQAQGASLLQVLETTGNALWVSSLSFVEASTPGTGGFIDTANQRLGVRHISPIITPDGLAQIHISDKKKLDGTPLRLADVANVVENHQPLIGDALSNDGAGLLLVVEKFPGANTLDVTRGVEDALAELRPGLSGLEMDSTIFRPADFIETAIRDVALMALVGLMLIALSLAAGFWEWRKVLISFVAIPLSLVAGGLALYLQGASVNALVLAGFALALVVVVDDAIIYVDHLAERLRQVRAAGQPKTAAGTILEASAEIGSPMLFATLIVL